MKVGLFIDYENIHISLSKQSLEIDYTKLDGFVKFCEEQYGKGSVSKAVAVAKWQYFMTQMESLVIFDVNCVHVTGTDKNASDLVLNIEAMQTCYEDDIDLFVLFTGDSDFLPLVRHLLKKGKQVRVVAVEGSHSKAMAILLKERLTFVHNELNDSLKQLETIDNRFIEMAKSIHLGMKNKNLSYYGRRLLFEHIKKCKGIYGELNDNEIGALIDDARLKYQIIGEREVTDTKSGRKVREVYVNYEHPRIQAHPFFQKIAS